jgi:tRNA U38,U39,U40 pseudouridine synthase TruA
MRLIESLICFSHAVFFFQLTLSLLLEETGKTVAFHSGGFIVRNGSSRSALREKDTPELLDAKDSNVSQQCNFCSETFASRNALFRHVSICDEVDNIQGQQEQKNEVKLRKKIRSTKHTFIFRIAYHATVDIIKLEASEAQLAGRQLQQAFKKVMVEYIHHERNDANASTDNYAIEKDLEIWKSMISTQSSLAVQRHKTLSQEIGCAAANDVVTISIVAPIEACGGDGRLLTFLLHEMQQHLDEVAQENNVVVKLLDVDNLKRTFHAENSATQRVYHYLLPLHWLKEGNELEQWWLKDIDSVIKVNTTGFSAFETQPPSNSLKTFRNALKRAESISVPNRRVRRRLLQDESSPTNGKDQSLYRRIEKVATRRLGTLTNRERRAWHNFADPVLQGEASPNQEPVWRVLDRARISHFLKEPNDNGGVVAVLEFQGDDFIPQQVRRVVGTALAVNNGWLPEDIFDLATSADSIMDTVLAPGGRLYLDTVRFHFDEDAIQTLSYDNKINVSCDHPTVWLSNQLMRKKLSQDQKTKELKWMRNIKNAVAPQMMLQLEARNESTLVNGHEPLEPPPEYYMAVLNLLRTVVESRKWPTTSNARSKVIRSEKDVSKGSERKQINGGSFTVVNPNVHRKSFELPQANSYFPALVEAVFDLEKSISRHDVGVVDVDQTLNKSKKECRKPSSHCAINFNAQFTPHVDSGRGMGQSLSMIVGLGDYSGGEIFVEGVKYPIRYNPLEFDGWKLRHWTNFYAGERFSLVYFTPEE